MPLHPAAAPLLELMADTGVGWSPDSTPQTMRAAMEASVVNGLHGRPAVHTVEERTFRGPASELRVRAYRPSAEVSSPVLVWIHGGGWVTGSLETHDHLCRLLCDATGAVVASVDYRLAPETKFPGAVDDSVAAWRWITAHASELGGDPARMALGGDSAGGNLAAVVALLARDQGLPVPVLQLLVYPVTDHEFESPSMIDNAQGYFLEADEMRWFFDLYAGSPADFGDWRMSPLRAPDVSGVPRAVVITAECDPLRDQGEAYARRLREAGVPTEMTRAEGLFHGFFGMHAFLAPARDAWDVAVGALLDAFGTV